MNEYADVIAGLTWHKLMLLRYINDFQEASLGRPPTYREMIANTPYKSTSHVQNDLKELQADGLIVNVQHAMPNNKLDADASRSYVIASSAWVPPVWIMDLEQEYERRLEEA